MNERARGPATMRPSLPGSAAVEGVFRHEAFLYEGADEFVSRTAGFISAGVAENEPILVMVTGDKVELLRSALGKECKRVLFADMSLVGRNPSRIIPAWKEFAVEHLAGNRKGRGVGEPIWAGRTPEELVECQRHEALLNLAFADAGPFWLVCPYDTGSLDRAVLEEAYRSHPMIVDGDHRAGSGIYRALEDVAAPFDRPLDEPPVPPEQMAFDGPTLPRVRALVAKRGDDHGLDALRTADLVLAVNELMTNSLRHATGRGVVRAWRDADNFVCEVRDEGRIADPLAGRARPFPDHQAGYGLWLVNQLCDLVQVRTFPYGTVVRVHMALR